MKKLILLSIFLAFPAFAQPSPGEGDATAANQVTGNALLTTIDADTSTIAGDTTSIDGKITACDTSSIAGTVTCNAGTNLNTSALATESGGNLDTIAGDTTSIDTDTTTIAGDTTSLDTLVTSIVKSEDAAHSSGDAGLQILGVRQDSHVDACDTEGDYCHLVTNNHGDLHTLIQHSSIMDDCNATTGWSVLGNDTDNLTTSTNHVYQTAALSFDKVNGAANTAIAGIQKTISSFDVDHFMEEGSGFFLGSMYFSTVADIEYAFLRAGTDSSNYNEWRVDDDNMVAGQWITLRDAIASPFTSVGNGWDSSAVTYMAVGVAFDGETDTLAAILVDGLSVNSGLQTSSDITAAISSSVSSPQVKINGWLGNVSTGDGVSGNGTLRVVNATDDPLLTTIDADTSSLAGTVGGSELQVDIVADGAGLATNAAQLADGHNVTIDNAAGASAVNIQDGGNDISVDGTVTANLSATDNTVLDNIDSDTTAIKTAVEVLDNAIAGSEMQVDIVSGGTGSTQYDEDDAHGSGDTGTLALVVRSDAGGSLCGADGDNCPLQVDSNGAMRVTGGGGGTEYTEDVASANPVVGTATVMERDDALAGLTPIEGDWAALRCSAEGALWVQEFNSDAILADTASMDTNLGTIAGDTTSMDADLTTIIDDVDGIETVLGTIDTDTGVIAGDTTSIDADTTTIIGHVDGIEALLGTIDGDTSNLSVVGGGTEAAAQRVTIANDSTGVLTVDDGGGALTIDGTVTANLSATDNTVLDNIDSDTTAIKTAVEVIDNVVSGSEAQVDVVASLPAGTNAIGKLAANTGVDIGDVDVTSIVPGTGATNLGKAEDGASAGGDTGVPAYLVRDDTLAAAGGVGADGDYMPARGDNLGALWTNSIAQSGVVADADRHADVKYAVINVAGADSDSIIAAVAGKQFRVLGYTITCDTAADITFEASDGTDFTGAMPVAANGGFAHAPTEFGLFETDTDNQALHILKSAATDCDGHITYIEVD